MARTRRYDAGRVTSDLDERRQVGKFRVEGLLGRGGMGAVYRAVGPDERPVAIKLIETSRDRDGSLARRFAREARIRIDHPNVVALLDAGVEEDGTPYIVFELLEGSSLMDRMRRAVLSAAEAISLALQTCAGLEAAHMMGIVHRDLKPGNLFVCHGGTVKVLDFGVARWATAEPDLTVGNRVVGTPAYLAPEQARGDGPVDGRADLWALGVVLYEALTGRRPFKRDSPVSTMLAIVLEDPVPIEEIRPDVPDELVDIVDRCLAKDRDLRFPSAAALRDALLGLDVPGVDQGVAPAGESQEDEAPSGTISVSGERTVAEPSPATSQIVPAMTRETMALSRPQVIVEGEERLVAVLFADGVRDAAAVERAVVEVGGVFIPLLARRQALGLFGAEAWEGDEVHRAATAALAGRKGALWISVASGRARAAGLGIAGDVVAAAEKACEAKLVGVAVAPGTAPLLGAGFALRELSDGTCEPPRTGAPSRRWASGTWEASFDPVGRFVEMEQLRRSLGRVLDEAVPGVVLVTGPPGIGKSHLRRAIQRTMAEDGRPITVMSGRAESLRRDVALGLVRDVLEARVRVGTTTRGWPRVDAEASLEERREGVRALATDVALERAGDGDDTTFLGELLGVPMPESAALLAARRDPQLMADRLHMAVVDYLAAACDTIPLALLVDDLQWADDASMSVLDALVDRLEDRPFFLLGTARPELDERWPGLFGQRGVTRLRLAGFNAREVGELTERTAGRPVPEDVVRAIVERTGGNPLFVEQIVTALSERRLLDQAAEELPHPAHGRGGRPVPARSPRPRREGAVQARRRVRATLHRRRDRGPRCRRSGAAPHVPRPSRALCQPSAGTRTTVARPSPRAPAGVRVPQLPRLRRRLRPAHG